MIVRLCVFMSPRFSIGGTPVSASYLQPAVLRRLIADLVWDSTLSPLIVGLPANSKLYASYRFCDIFLSLLFRLFERMLPFCSVGGSPNESLASLLKLSIN